MSMTVTELKPEIGVEITGVEGHDFVDPGVAADCLAALDAHGVVVYREAHVGADDLVAFSHLLGEVELRPTFIDSGYAEINIVSRKTDRSQSASTTAGTFVWHIDGTSSQTAAEFPHKATLLSCQEVSDDDTGDTEFANTYAAYDALPDEDKALIDGLLVEYGYTSKTYRSIPGVSEHARELWENTPPKARRLMWARQSGRKSMLLGSTACQVVGWSPEESEALLDRLLEWSTQPRFVLRHHWHVGDVVLWDNTGMLHRAYPYEETSQRLMHRIALLGTQSVA
jgi:alpha-ketoglutarate-dependent taurine dioxygenase